MLVCSRSLVRDEARLGEVLLRSQRCCVACGVVECVNDALMLARGRKLGSSASQKTSVCVTLAHSCSAAANTAHCCSLINAARLLGRAATYQSTPADIAPKKNGQLSAVHA